jgi:hypothetical protein
MTSSCEVIGKNLVKKETNVQPFINLKVTLSTGEIGIIEGSFGQSGKIKIRFMGNNFHILNLNCNKISRFFSLKMV